MVLTLLKVASQTRIKKAKTIILYVITLFNVILVNTLLNMRFL